MASALSEILTKQADDNLGIAHRMTLKANQMIRQPANPFAADDESQSLGEKLIVLGSAIKHTEMALNRYEKVKNHVMVQALTLTLQHQKKLINDIVQFL